MKRLFVGLALLIGSVAWADEATFTIHPRGRQGNFVTVGQQQLDAKKTAIVICDMWDKHWCPAATERVGQMAPRMNQVINAARAKGALIIHCPSDTMPFYADTPQRKLALASPVVKTAIPLERWCYLDKMKEIALPIDDSDGGCDTPDVKSHKAWSRQIATLEIKDGDAISEGPDAFYLMKQRGITNVVIMGVHTNMCVLGRPFGIRQLTQQGMNVYLMRDMTDTMYNPARRPFVSHFTGTDLVIEHVEQHWCPTILSGDFLDGKEYRFPADTRPHLVMLIGEDEYKTEESLPAFAKSELGKQFRVSLVLADPKKPNEFPNIAAVGDADILLVSVRRRMLPESQLAYVRKHVAAGKPVVGIRTASHAFELAKGGKLASGMDEWAKFDIDVLGCDYTGHHGAKLPTYAMIDAKVAHPVTAKIDPKEFRVTTSLYKSAPVNENAIVLATGRAETVKGTEPIAWVWTRPDGGRSFYTALGGVDDFQIPAFRQLLRQGIEWAAAVNEPMK